MKCTISCLWVSAAGKPVPAITVQQIPVGKCFLISVSSSKETMFRWNSDHRGRFSKNLTVARETHHQWSWPVWFASPRWLVYLTASSCSWKVLWGYVDLCSSGYMVLPNVCYLTPIRREPRVFFCFFFSSKEAWSDFSVQWGTGRHERNWRGRLQKISNQGQRQGSASWAAFLRCFFFLSCSLEEILI